MGQHQSGPGQRTPQQAGPGVVAPERGRVGPEDQRREDESGVFRDCAPQIGIGQVVGRVGVDQRRQHSARVAEQAASVAKGSQRGSQRAEGDQQFDRAGRGDAQQAQPRGRQVTQRRVEVQHRLAVAEAKLGEEARVEHPLFPGPRQRRRPVDVEQPVVGDEEPGMQQWQQGRQGQQHRQQIQQFVASR